MYSRLFKKETRKRHNGIQAFIKWPKEITKTSNSTNQISTQFPLLLEALRKGNMIRKKKVKGRIRNSAYLILEEA